jgi:hypothetical protein
LANIILRYGGAVYGALYDYTNERLEHCSTDVCSLEELRKSKYIESYTGTIFVRVKNDLKQGRWVLFCGTPCQVSGLSLYLEKNKIPTTKLLRVRFVCHGVPSNKFFTEYKHYEEQRFGGKMTKFDFRPKNNGWASSDWYMEFSNGKSNRGAFTLYYYYYYYYFFQRNYLLRESCYSCHHLWHEEVDFTIADFWGIAFYKPEYKEAEGLSLVLAHNEKAMTLMRHIAETCSVEELPASATDYIYKDIKYKEMQLYERNQMMHSVLKDGYMNVAKKTLRNKICKHKIYGFLLYFKHKILGK